jgi:antitoxin ParD1/3/4
MTHQGAGDLVDADEQHVESLVRSGRYQNASEVMREGLRLVERREAEDAVKLQALREAAAVGWRNLEAGRFHDVPDEALGSYMEELGRCAAERVRPGRPLMTPHPIG